MPLIQPLDIGSLRDPDLKALVERCTKAGVPDAVFIGMLARVPDYAKALVHALLVSHGEGHVDHRLKELIRIQLAHIAGDKYFAGLRSTRARAEGLDEETIAAGHARFEQDVRFTPAEKWALRYARNMYLDSAIIDAAFYAEGRRHYSEAEIMELGAFIAFHYGMQVFMRTMDPPHTGD